MIEKVDFSGTTYKGLPSKFEAGTPNISGVMGLKSAINYLNSLDRVGAAAHEQSLLEQSTKALSEIEGLKTRHPYCLLSLMLFTLMMWEPF